MPITAAQIVASNEFNPSDVRLILDLVAEAVARDFLSASRKTEKHRTTSTLTEPENVADTQDSGPGEGAKR